MLRFDKFMDDFQKDHSKLLNLVTSFRSAIETSKLDKAKEILTKMDGLSNRHFSFEENYLYPRLRRLVIQITEGLHCQQQMVREFISKSGSFLNKKRCNKNKLTSLLDMLPGVSKFFKDCNDLVFLVEKFDKEDKDDLNRRFRECCGRKI